MSLSVANVLSSLEPYPYLLLFSLVVEGPIVTIAAGLLRERKGF